MKKARFWAIFMTGLLVFSTLTNDYIVANAEELEGFEDTVVEELPKLDAEDGYEMSVEPIISEGDGDKAEGTTVAEAFFDGFVDMINGDGDEGSTDGTEFTDGGEYTEGDEYTDSDETTGEEDVDEEDTDEEDVDEEAEYEELAEEELEDEELEDEEEEVKYPAIDFGTKSVAGIKVSISAPEGAFPEGTEVVVKPASTSKRSIESELSNDVEVVDIVAVDITFMYKGEEIQPKESVNVEFSSLDLEGDSLAVFHESNGDQDKVTSTTNTDSVSINASSFSVYTVVGISPLKVNQTEDEEEGDEETDESGEETVSNLTKVGNTVVYLLDVYRNAEATTRIKRETYYNGEAYNFAEDKYTKTDTTKKRVAIDNENAANYAILPDALVSYVNQNYEGCTIYVTNISLNGEMRWDNKSDQVRVNCRININEHDDFIANQITATIKCQDENGDPIGNPETITGVEGDKVTVDEEAKSIPGYDYVGSEPGDSITLTKDGDNTITLKFKKIEPVGVKVRYNYQNLNMTYDSAEPETIEGVTAEVGSQYTWDGAPSTKEYDGITYSLKSVSTIKIGKEADENIVNVYYDRPQVSYSVEFYYMDQNHYNYTYANTETITGTVPLGAAINYSPKEKTTRNDINYDLDSNKSICTIEAGEVDPNANNVLQVYYTRKSNTVYWSILMPGVMVPSYTAESYGVDEMRYPEKNFSTGNGVGKRQWESTVDDMDGKMWDYTLGTSLLDDHNTSVPENLRPKINAWLAEKYPAKNDDGDPYTWEDVIWYTYKCDKTNYEYGDNHGTSDWYINGYIPIDTTTYDTAIIVQAVDASKTYNGADFTIDDISGEKYTLADSTKRALGGYTVTADTYIDGTAPVHVGETGVHKVDINSIKIWNGETEITDKFNRNNFRVVDGTLSVNPVPVTITTGSDSKEYDGTPLTKDEATVSGLVDGETVEIHATGSIVGNANTEESRDNTYSIDWDAETTTAAKSDYEIVDEKLGTLTVTPTTPTIPVPVPTPDNPTPDNPTPDNPTPDNPTPNNPTPDNPVTETVTSIVPVVETTTIPDAEVPLAGVLGAQRGIEADDSSVLGQRRAAAEAGVLGARRDAETSDANHMAMYLMLMGIATGVGGAYTLSRRKKHEN